MGVFISNSITDRGRILLGEAQTGATFEATKIVMGSGYIPAGSTAATMTAVVSPVVELAINKKKRVGDGMVTFGGAFSNESITEAFYFREFALYARVQYADGTYSDEALYSYGNAGGNADLIPAYSTSTVVERQMDLVVWVGNETVVNLTVESGLYNPHAGKHAADGEDPLTPEMIGAVRAKPLGSYGAETTIAAQVQYWFDQHIRWGIFHAALCADLPPETVNWDHGVEFKVLSGFRVEVTVTSLNALTFIRHYDAHTKSWMNDWVSSNDWNATELPDGADLNDYKEPGRYYKISGADAFLNTPTIYGSIALIVERTGAYGVGVVQTVKDHKGNVYVRSFAAESDSDWTSWGWTLASNRSALVNVPANGGYRIKNTDTGAASDFMAGRGYTVMRIMDEYDNAANYREIMLVGANGSPGTSHAIRFLDVVDGVGKEYALYHSGNAPAVIATAELV